MLRRLLSAVSAVSFALGGLWALAGVLRLVFGVRVTLALVPPLALDRVEVGPALAMALGFTLLAAVAGRAGNVRHVGPAHAPPDESPAAGAGNRQSSSSSARQRA